MTLLTGTLLARGRRTVAAALRASSNARAGDWSLFHQVLNRARWSPLAQSRQLLLLIVETFVPAGAYVDLVIDETLERRWGNKISKRGHYRDSALSSKKRSVSSPWLRWIVMAVVVIFPWTKQRWALPFLCVLATTPEVSGRLGKRHKTVGMWAHQLISLVRRWLPDREIKLMGDTAYTVVELGVHAQKKQVTLVMTGHLDAVLHAPPPERTAHTIGRPRVVGPRFASLQQVGKIRRRTGIRSPWTGTGRGSAWWRSARTRRCGTVRGLLPCRSVGSSRVIQQASVPSKPSFPRTQPSQWKRSSRTL
jgi:hypothetical protein